MAMMGNTKNTVVITGGATGIGGALSREYAKNGHSVVAVGRNAEALEELQKQFPESVRSVVADIATREGRDAIKAALSTGEKVDIIHCAATVEPSPIMTATEEQFDAVMTTDVKAPLLITQSLKDNLDNSRVLFMSSGAATGPLSGIGVYAMAKAALESQCRSFRVETEKSRAVFSILLPGVVNTAMQELFRSCSGEVLPSFAFFQKLAEDKKLREPEVVAQFIYWTMEKTEREVFNTTTWNINNPPSEYANPASQAAGAAAPSR